MDDLHDQIQTAALTLRQVADDLETLATPIDTPPWTDIINTLPINTDPDQKYFIQRQWTWWPFRKTEDVTGITIHHTMSHSPQATAAYCTRPATKRGKGYPTIQYHFWISASDGCPIYLCVPVTTAVWHDNTGAFQTTISVGMAGHLHKVRPPDEQILATVQLVRYLMDLYNIPITEVQGHNDRMWATTRRRTDCPGWDATYAARPSGNWRGVFFSALQSLK